MKRGPLVLVGLLVFLVLAGSAYAVRARRGISSVVARHAPDSTARAPAGVRVRVQVINTTRTRGLARRATRVLRDQGFDVVEMSTGGPVRDTTLVLDRSGHPAWAATVAKLLGPAARSETRPDSSHYLDVTVLLGSTWRAPAEPLNP
ncbi:MAG TPA: LytR C-terminal domain-containing protein [Gemmatimonadaceae bacterium]